jgi:outer membrane protein assembly factor BamB
MSGGRAAVGLVVIATLMMGIGCTSRSVTPRSPQDVTQTVQAPPIEPQVEVSARQLGPHALPEIQWRFQTRGKIVAAPTELEGGDIAVGSLDGTLYRVSANGKLVYSVDTGAPIRSRPIATTHANVLVGNESGSVLHIDGQGNVVWRAQLRGPIASDPIAGANGVLFVPADGIYALDGDGNVLWHHVEPTTIYDPLALDASEVLRFNTVDGRRVTLDARGQVLTTERREPAEPANSPIIAVVDAAGVAYRVGADQMLRATRDDGSELWSYSLGVNVTASVLLAASGTLLIGTDDGILYALH